MEAPVRHVAHVTECLAGGTLGVLRQLTGELAHSSVRQTLIYCRRPDSPEDIESLFDNGVRLVEVRPARGTHLDFIADIVRALHFLVSHDPPDVVHLHSAKAGFIGRLALRTIDARRGAHTRIFYSPHGLSFLNPRRPWMSAAYWALEKLAGRVDCQPVACGASEANALENVSRCRARILENPVDPFYFSVQREEPQRPVVMTVGRVCEQKGPDIFAELSVRMRLEIDNARFVWVGAGDPRPEAMLRAVGVEVTGWLPQEAVRACLANASVYVQTSRWEGLPLSVLQAMAVGLPCLVLDAVGNRDAIEHDKTGLIAWDIDELEMYLTVLLGSAPLRERLGSSAREQARDRFSLERFHNALLDLYGMNTVPAIAGPSAIG